MQTKKTLDRQVATTILFAESEARRRESISVLLLASGHRLIVASAAQEAIEKAREFSGPIHMLLANLEMPDMTGIELGRRLNQDRPDMKIFLLAHLPGGMVMLDDDWEVLSAPTAFDKLILRIRSFLKGSEPAAHEVVTDRRGTSGLRSLTERENEVLRLIAGGHSTKQTAAILGIAFKTCVGHRTRLMRKLNIHDSVALVRYAIRSGMIEP